MERGDWAGLDRALVAALDGWRRRSAALAELPPSFDLERDLPVRLLAETPVPEALIHEETRHELAERASDPIAAALVPWVESLAQESALYPSRFALATAWSTGRAVRGRPTLVTASGLRREVLGAPHAVLRARAADELAAMAPGISEVALRGLETRLEREVNLPPDCRSLAVAELREPGGRTPVAAAALANRALAATDELAAALGRDAWHETLRLALATEATEGWPVRPTLRWLRAVFGGEDWTRGLRLGPVRLPAPWGAVSYARALGALGMRLLDAGRPATMPFALHQHPFGVRRHVRRALFVGIVAEESFAQRVLGLGRARARDHRRAMLAAYVTSVRIDALRVLVATALRDGLRQARELGRELGERVLGGGASPDLLGVLPTLRPGDGAAFCGALAAVLRREALVARHDDDWFQNPRALAELRAEDGVARDSSHLDPDALERAIASIRRDAEFALG